MGSPAGGSSDLYADLARALVLTAATGGLALTVMSASNLSFLAMLQSFDSSHSYSSNNPQALILWQAILTGLVIEWPLVFACYRAACKTRGSATIISSLQIIVLAYFSQWLVWKYLNFDTVPLAILLGLLAAFAWGRVDQARSDRRKIAEDSKIVLALKEKEIKEAHLQLVKQDEADRRILASDLHDQVLNDLKALRSALDLLKKSQSGEDAHLNQIEAIESMVDAATGQVREVMENLTPSVLENLGLANALDDLLRRCASRGKFKARFKNDGQEALEKLSQIESLLVFRTVQEALSNTVKHAGAGKVEMEISTDDNGRTLIISITDDGSGIAADKERGQSRGLRYMRQRMDLIGGNIAWLPGKEQKGCRVELRLNIHEAIKESP
ncbi:MAG: hypothetical protein JSS83_21610 [Cyanobacteria bacterium SZAS LIN-3]|nr:hypothetical protein [Cyanobacteria bacterium SZAS LIN-3]